MAALCWTFIGLMLICLCPYYTNNWRLRLRLRLRLLINQKEAYNYQLLSDWLRGANANVDAIANR